jgi:mono/diheme cytochrome c family protein
MQNVILRGARVLAVVLSLVLLTAFSAGAQSAGETLFKAKCAMCHGADGGGKTVMGEKLQIRDLRSAEVQKQSDAELTQIITKGKNKMVAYEGKLSKEQIEQLVAQIRELGKKH